MFFRNTLDEDWKGVDASHGVLLFKSSPKEVITQMNILQASSLPQEQLKTFASGYSLLFSNNNF